MTLRNIRQFQARRSGRQGTAWAACVLLTFALACQDPTGKTEQAETAAAAAESRAEGEPADEPTDDDAPETETEPAAEVEEAVYDPAEDPLVNPPRMLEPPPKDNPGVIAEDEVLVRLLSGNPNSLNPIFMSSVYEFYLADLLFTGLFSFDEKMQWFVNDEVVESYEESEDHLVSTVKLRPGMTWHDGEPFTAHDVRFSWEAILDDRVPSPAMKPGTDQIENVVVLDDLTLEFHHKAALPTNKWNMMFAVLPEHIYGNPEERAEDPTLKSSEYYNRFNRSEIVGNGPYKLVEWITNDRIVVERWEDFRGEKPHFKRQILKIQPDSNTALLMFKKGDLDEMGLSAQQFATQTNDKDFAAVGHKAYGSQWSFNYIGWNMDGSNPFFGDPRVRVAMAHALDIPKIIRDIYYNLATQCHGIYHPDAPMYNENIELFEYDLEKAAALLDEAGWIVSEDDGWRYKEIDGKPVRFSFTLLIPQGSSTSPKIAAIFQRDLRRIGVELKTQVLEWATFLERVRGHDFQAEIAGWGTGTDPDTGWNLWRSDQYEKGRNYGGYANERVDELFELGRSEFDHDKRMAHYAEIQKIIYEDQPYLFISNASTTWAIHKRLRGVMFSPRGLFNFDPSYMNWWVHKNDRLRP